MSFFKNTAVCFALASALAAPALAAPVTYTFATTGKATGSNATLVGLLGSANVTGSFKYNSASPLLGQSGDLGYESGYAVYAGTNAGNLALSLLSGSVGGHLFSDSVGSVSVGNNFPVYGDILTLNADSTVPVGANTPNVDTYPLSGFTLGDYTLRNVRITWIGALGAGNFLPDSNLPGQLPAAVGRVSLDFVRTNDPTNLAGVPFYSNTVFFDGLKVTASAVPEADSLALLAFGLAVVGGVAGARRKSLR